MQVPSTTHIVTGSEAAIAAEVEAAAANVETRAEYERRLVHKMTATYRMLEAAGLLD